MGVQVSAQEDVNPFKTPSKAPASGAVEQVAPPTSLDSFQFNGIMKQNGVTRISIYDTNTKRNIWLNENEVGELGVSFRRFDNDNGTVVIDQGGVSKKLTLNKVKIESLKIAPSRPNNPNPSPAATANANQRSGGAAVGRAESDEEARARIQRVAEEIRRRRAERRQQLEQRNRNSGN